MILQIAIIFFYLALGELVVWVTGVPIPSSIIGMILLAASLSAGWLDIRRVDRAAEFLVRNLGFFFVPAGVGLINCLDIIAAEWLPIVATLVISTFAVIASTGWTHQFIRRLFAHNHSSDNGIPD